MYETVLKEKNMKNFMIFLSIIVVLFFASMDAKERLQELETMSLKTPAQVEMKQNIFDKQKQERSGEYQNKQHQNNNLPQNKQEKPLIKK